MEYKFTFGIILGFTLAIIVFYLTTWRYLYGSDDQTASVLDLNHNSSMSTISDEVEEEEEEAIDCTPKIPDEVYTIPVPSFSHRTSKAEEECRVVLEELIGEKCPPAQPDFLINPETGRRLELDCYNERYKIALEYNGIQHYVWPNFTKQSKQEFIAQVRRDIFRVDMCDRNGVYLITVPYNVKSEYIRTYIEYYLKKRFSK